MICCISPILSIRSFNASCNIFFIPSLLTSKYHINGVQININTVIIDPSNTANSEVIVPSSIELKTPKKDKIGETTNKKRVNKITIKAKICNGFRIFKSIKRVSSYYNIKFLNIKSCVLSEITSKIKKEDSLVI